jgi:hypothetical protein
LRGGPDFVVKSRLASCKMSMRISAARIAS